MPPVPSQIDGWFVYYGIFFANLGASSLGLLTILTTSSGMKIFMNMEKKILFILSIATIYLIERSY
ncbi:predicted protein [Arabidopsis lyrata subsp. lyrata]|uniref:Predicted protein n=1 Tax=Arabidopsis lyrata subsp. lyrata TaxID=81972 RepID=D7LJL1_ARALL|nr:predicted protein [Arabidopsis lyrata subsp. lyrata]